MMPNEHSRWFWRMSELEREQIVLGAVAKDLGLWFRGFLRLRPRLKAALEFDYDMRNVEGE